MTCCWKLHSPGLSVRTKVWLAAGTVLSWLCTSWGTQEPGAGEKHLLPLDRAPDMVVVGEVVPHCWHSLQGWSDSFSRTVSPSCRSSVRCCCQTRAVPGKATLLRNAFLGCYGPLPGMVGPGWAGLLWELCCCSPLHRII